MGQFRSWRDGTPDGKVRGFPDIVQNARKSVAIAIDRAIEEMRQQDAETALHFESRIKTGARCSYRASGDVRLRVSRASA